MKISLPLNFIKNKRLFFFTFLIFSYLFSGISGATEIQHSTFYVPYRSYTFDYWGKAVEGPISYLPKRTISAREFGLDNLRQPKDLAVDPKNGDIYIADTGNHRIIHLDSEWNLLRVINQFNNGDLEDKFSNPNSLVITSEQHIYVADTDNARIVRLDQDGNLVQIYTSPHVENEGIFPSDFKFRPTKVGVNNKGHLFIISQDFFDGFITMDADGIFRGLIGAPKVSVSLTEYLWFLISTDEQRARRRLFLPTEYSGFTLDNQGFIYATVASDEDDAIRRLNPAGANSLRKNGRHDPIGDINYTNMWDQSTYYGRSNFVDVTVMPLGVYSVLDRTRSRVYTYDADGNLLYMFGYRGQAHGQIARGVAIENIGLDLLVLDDVSGKITVFEPTEYTKMIWTALEHYDKGEYAEEELVWRQILKENANYDLAYTGIGRSLLLREDFESSMFYFKHGNNRTGYSRAFQEYRKERLENVFGFIMTGIILVILMIIFLPKLIKRDKTQTAASREAQWVALTEQDTLKAKLLRVLHSLKYGFHVMVRPFDGFYELKHRKRGSLSASFVIIIFVTITYTLMRQYTGFLFNDNNPSELNIIVEFASVLLPFFLWVGVNWGFTTLMTGKGTFKDIIIASAYALLPIILINIPLIVVSNYLVLEEGSFYYLLLSVAVIWSGFLMFVGAVMTTHDYGFFKAAFTTILTLVGMVFTIFLGLVLLNVLELVVRFINEVFTEIAFRI